MTNCVCGAGELYQLGVPHQVRRSPSAVVTCRCADVGADDAVSSLLETACDMSANEARGPGYHDPYHAWGHWSGSDKHLLLGIQVRRTGRTVAASPLRISVSGR